MWLLILTRMFCFGLVLYLQKKKTINKKQASQNLLKHKQCLPSAGCHKRSQLRSSLYSGRLLYHFQILKHLQDSFPFQCHELSCKCSFHLKFADVTSPGHDLLSLAPAFPVYVDRFTFTEFLGIPIQDLSQLADVHTPLERISFLVSYLLFEFHLQCFSFSFPSFTVSFSG